MVEYIKIILDFIQGVAWPLIILLCVYWLRKPLIDAFGRADKIAINSKGIELTLSKLENSIQLSPIQRKELSGLTANEIWALEDLSKTNRAVAGLNAAQKVGVRTLLDMGLVEFYYDNKIQRVRLTEIGKKLLEIANTLI